MKFFPTETGNKGDAAIWTGQNILFAYLGISTMETCRYMSQCDLAKFNASLEAHPNSSAIVLAGGGNFNDYYWDDLPSKVAVASSYPNVPIRGLPQSIYVRGPEHSREAITGFASNHDLLLSARDQPSYNWLQSSFGTKASLVKPDYVRTIMTPDMAYMWGPRPDFRRRTTRIRDVLFVLRKDREALESTTSYNISYGAGVMTLRSHDALHHGIEASFENIDWKFIETPDLADEQGLDQRAAAKANFGFQILSGATFIITDRLHVHIMSTLVGIPHVLLDSKLGKNFAYYHTWTKGCNCVRIANDMDGALRIARNYFAENPDKLIGQRRP